ncbi:MAG: restriction endonuclease subunit S [Syntrophorhabdaceae bacterium]|nr:restriction endonuclease subunit S [Syntrophorhabdaceae bacterium]
MKNGWQRKQIRDLCEVIAGQSPEGKFYNADGEGMPFYQGKKDFGDRFITAPTTWTTQTTKVAQEGDILMSVRAPVGPINFATGEVCIGRGLAAIRCGSELNRDFLFYQLLHLQPDIAGKEGAVFASINKSEIEALPLAFSPLSEQQRIVGILDEAFEGIAIAKANTEKNLQNARALFESHLQSVFTQRDEGWQRKQIGEVCEIVNGGTPKTGIEEYWGGKNLWITPAEMGKRATPYVDQTERTITDDGLRNSSASLLPPYSVILSSRAPIGHLVINTQPMATNQGCKGLVPSKQLEYKYLYHYLNSIVGILNDLGTGATFKELSGGKLKEVLIPVPPLPEQQRIVVELDSLRQETQGLESIYRQKLTALDELKKSLLHQAFSGEL